MSLTRYGGPQDGWSAKLGLCEWPTAYIVENDVDAACCRRRFHVQIYSACCYFEDTSVCTEQRNQTEKL